MEINYQAIGQRIQAARIKKNLTQEILSNLTDLSTSHVCHIENGKTKVSLPALIDIANALGVTVDSLLYDNLWCFKNPTTKTSKTSLPIVLQGTAHHFGNPRLIAFLAHRRAASAFKVDTLQYGTAAVEWVKAAVIDCGGHCTMRVAQGLRPRMVSHHGAYPL